MSLRAEVAVPASIAFLFGSALGLTVGWLVASGGQTQPERGPSQAQAQAQPSSQQAAASEEVQLREALSMHQELLANEIQASSMRASGRCTSQVEKSTKAMTGA